MRGPSLRIGGQAVIEGVMMKSERSLAIAVRDRKGVSVKTRTLKKKRGWTKLPIVRGIVNLVEMLVIGMQALNYSMEKATGEENKLSALTMFLIMAFSLVFAVAIFKFIPLIVAQVIVGETRHAWLFSLIDGLAKIIIFFLYVYLIGRMKDIRRVFKYHGAEHMTVHCHEAGLPLTVRNARRFSPIHARCGTSFIVFVLIVGIIVYSFIPMGSTFLQKFLIRLALLPLIAGLAYEFLRLEHLFRDNALYLLLLSPGLLFQRLTTAQPSDSMIKVAIAALAKVRRMG
ncbi:MAG: DUF1385 domain-containing protein [Nanoarchaeota archaeon]